MSSTYDDSLWGGRFVAKEPKTLERRKELIGATFDGGQAVLVAGMSTPSGFMEGLRSDRRCCTQGAWN